MTDPASSHADQTTTRLPWDSNEFGFEVGRLVDADLEDAALEVALDRARESDFALVYWNATSDRNPSAELVERFTGALVDRKVTYTRTLPGGSLPESDQAPQDSVVIQEYPSGAASEQMIALAVAAGQQSRFCRDERFPEDVLKRLYTTWIERSTRREISDVVLSALDAWGNEVGLITLSLQEDTCHIGLVAVDAAFRRAGVAKRLLGCSHEWGVVHGAGVASVVTQADNRPACRLYERCGYRLHDVAHIYHFWLR